MMRILLLISESWNDTVHPNNNMSNWFTDFPDTEIYTIQCGPEKPKNRCCRNYFSVCDAEMVKSFLPGNRAGKILRYDEYPIKEDASLSNIENRVYNNRNKLHNGFARLLRSVIWRFGRYNKKLMKRFIDDFQPDIIFSQRMGSVKMCRLEKIVQSLCDAPMVAYTGDNEYAIGLSAKDLFEKINRSWTRHWLDKMIPTYSLYYNMSEEQMDFYEKKFGVKTKFLVKCGFFSEESIHKSVNDPIRLLYAGKLYAGRATTLSLLVETIMECHLQYRFHLDIYTSDSLDPAMESVLNDGVVSQVHSAISASALKDLYETSDIVLHVEGLDEKNALATRFSFSTKIVDCLASGCALMAICDVNQAGFKYLRNNNLAFTAGNQAEIKEILGHICHEPDTIPETAGRALQFGRKYHQRQFVQKSMQTDFEEVIHKKC